MQTLQAVIEGIVFRNDENGYTVLDISVDGELQTAVGNLPEIFEGMNATLTGEWASHATYGKQFRIETLRLARPDDEEGIVRYLSSGIIPGVGPVTAQKIVNLFGRDTLDIIAREPQKLTSLRGMTLKRATQISQCLSEHADTQEAAVFLESLGLSPAYAQRVYKVYGTATEKLVSADPYRMIGDIEGIGFKTADSIAVKLGLSADSPARVRAALQHALRESASQSGHTCLPQDMLTMAAQRLIGADADVDTALKALKDEGKVKLEELDGRGFVWLSSYYRAEKECALRLIRLSAQSLPIPWLDHEKMIARVAREQNADLTGEQLSAVNASLVNGVTVITGGPGTGKTTTIRVMIAVFEAAGLEVALAAPTGRAAKRMTEATQHEASTLHRLLEYTVNGEGSGAFSRDETNPLDAMAIIIDEMSMVDISLMQSLLSAVQSGARLVLVGDSDQLPSVGAGNVLKDIISSGMLPVIRLKKIFRQAEKSLIIRNAHMVNSGQMPVLDDRRSDFFFEHKDSEEEALKSVLALVKTRLPGYGGYESMRDIQVLAPMKKGPLGVIALNEALRDTLNPQNGLKNEIKVGGEIFREGDKVMQIKNNYSLKWRRSASGADEEGEGVFNGDIGFITSLDIAGRLASIEFDDGRVAEYDFPQLEELRAAYAVSIHKSQGSEFPVVVLPLVSGPPMLLCRNLLYTAITRARKLVVITGLESCVRRMVENDKVIQRYSALRTRLCEAKET